MTRREDFRLITGQGRYTADWNIPGQLHAVFLRSDRAHAEIARLDAARARAHPGVIAVLTGKEVQEAGFKSMPNNVNYPGRDGHPLAKPHYAALASTRVRFVGEPVAMVVARTVAIAEDARELLEVEYRELPAVANSTRRCERAHLRSTRKRPAISPSISTRVMRKR
jgi:carbon-monoxide dehydrogenase large subunit